MFWDVKFVFFCVCVYLFVFPTNQFLFWSKGVGLTVFINFTAFSKLFELSFVFPNPIGFDISRCHGHSNLHCHLSLRMHTNLGARVLSLT